MIQYKESASVNGVFVRNASTTGYAAKTETVTLPVSGPFVMELEEKIQPGSTVNATIDAVEAEIRPWSFAASAGSICIDREHGRIKYAGADGGLDLSVTYTPAGTVVSAAKFESVADGLIGPTGEGVPEGGTAGQVLAKIDGVDYNTEWVDQSGGGGDELPSGGAMGEYLRKASGTDGDFEWGDPADISAYISVIWGAIGGSLSSQTDLQAALNGKLGTSGDGSSLTNLNPANLSAAVPTTKGGTGLTTLGTAGQGVVVNSGATGYQFTSTGVGQVVHGATAATARPTWAGPIQWVGTVEPDNMVAGDSWLDTSV